MKRLPLIIVFLYIIAFKFNTFTSNTQIRGTLDTYYTSIQYTRFFLYSLMYLGFLHTYIIIIYMEIVFSFLQ